MKFQPNWKAIIIVDSIFIGGILFSLFIVNRPVFQFFWGDIANVKIDYFAVFMADFVLIFMLFYMVYIQYCQINTRFLDDEIIRPRLFGKSRFNWFMLESVVLNMYVVNMVFQSGKMSVLIYLFSDADEVISFISNRYSEAVGNRASTKV